MSIPGKYEIRLKDFLDYFSQEEILHTVLSYYPREGEYVCSPFRIDRNPKCYFEYGFSGKLRFIDWADSDNNHIDCFEFVKRVRGYRSQLNVIHFLYDKLVEGLSEEELESRKETITPVRAEIKAQRTKAVLSGHICEFNDNDRDYWWQYGITEEQLKEDKVFAVDKVYLKPENKEEFVTYCSREKVYIDLNFQDNTKKIAFPEARQRGKSIRFLTNCTANSIGNYTNISIKENYLIITKSQKDHRVLKNLGYHNTCYFSNEGQFPDRDLLFELIFFYKRIYIFFDDDRAGHDASTKLKERIEQLLQDIPHRVELYEVFTGTEECKDISDYYKAHGKEASSQLLSQQIFY